MNFSDKQQERLQFQNKFSSDTSSIPQNSSSLTRKRETLIRTYEEPVLPKVAKILFISMILLTLVMIAVDLKNGIPYIDQIGLKAIFQNASQSALIMWGAYTVLVCLVCGIGMTNNNAAVRRKAKEGRTNIWTKEDDEQTKRSVRRLNSEYRLYILFSVMGLIFLCLLSCVVYFLV